MGPSGKQHSPEPPLWPCLPGCLQTGALPAPSAARGCISPWPHSPAPVPSPMGGSRCPWCCFSEPPSPQLGPGCPSPRGPLMSLQVQEQVSSLGSAVGPRALPAAPGPPGTPSSPHLFCGVVLREYSSHPCHQRAQPSGVTPVAQCQHEEVCRGSGEPCPRCVSAGSPPSDRTALQSRLKFGID